MVTGADAAAAPIPAMTGSEPVALTAPLANWKTLVNAAVGGELRVVRDCVGRAAHWEQCTRVLATAGAGRGWGFTSSRQ